MDLDLNKKFEPKELFHVGKYDPQSAISAIYYEGERKWTMVKRFKVETSKTGQRYPFLTEHKQTKLLYATVAEEALVAYNYRTKEGKVDKEIALTSFIDVKGWKSLGNKLEDVKVTIPKRQPKPKVAEKTAAAKDPKKLTAGDSIEFDLEDNGQTKMFD